MINIAAIRKLKSLIVIHICYRDVFNAPLAINDLILSLGIREDNIVNFKEAISSLISEKLIEERDGYLVAFGNVHLIEDQPEKNRLTKFLINKGERFLGLFAKLPFVKFIGISGSLAANNPTLDKNGTNKGTVDLDLFVISRVNTLWILFLLERIITNFRKLIFRNHFYCFNYVTDESFLEIHNKNFYTATELNNLIPIYNDNILERFLSENNWYEKYYSKQIPVGKASEEESNFFFKLLMPLNYLCFVLFCIGRAIKRLELGPLFEISSKFNPVNKCNLKRIANSNGGYQEAIKNKFQTTFESKFSKYYSIELISDLFPESGSFEFSQDNIYDLEISQLFEKYAS